MRRRLFLVLAVVCCIAVFAGVFAGCNNDGKGGGGNTGAGDKIFTEGATLEEILTALEKAESFTQTQWWKESGTDHWGDEYTDEVTYRYEVTDSAVVQHSESFEGAEPTSSVLAQYRSGDIDYEMEYAEDGEIYWCSKSLAAIYPEQYSYEAEFFGVERFGDMPVKYADGKISFDHESAENNAIDGYVKGSGYVRLNGSSIEIGWDFDYSYEENGVDRGGLDADMERSERHHGGHPRRCQGIGSASRVVVLRELQRSGIQKENGCGREGVLLCFACGRRCRPRKDDKYTAREGEGIAKRTAKTKARCGMRRAFLVHAGIPAGRECAKM